MRNLLAYDGSCLEFQINVINAKDDSEFKQLALSISEEISTHNNHYCERFDNNSLNSLIESNTSIADFRNLYYYSAKQFVLLKNSLTTGAENRIIKL